MRVRRSRGRARPTTRKNRRIANRFTHIRVLFWTYSSGHLNFVASGSDGARGDPPENILRSVNNIVGAICDRSAWSLSNLAIQKAAYICQLLYIGEAKAPLFAEDFEAWDYGPVQPRLYHNLKMFGSQPVKPMSYLLDTTLPDDLAKDVVDQVAKLAINSGASQLVQITHWERGAWAKNYRQGTRGITIPKADIQAEYQARVAAQAPRTL